MKIVGLDNGFIVKSTNRQITSKDLPEGIITPFSDSYNPNGEDIVYWRKNYGLRNAIRKVLGMSNDEFTYEIDTPKQILNIVEIIFHFKDKTVWKDEGDSIWDYIEIEPILQRDIINLVLMIPFMKENPDVYIEFYDSY
jgi:hypothetical protein